MFEVDLNLFELLTCLFDKSHLSQQLCDKFGEAVVDFGRGGFTGQQKTQNSNDTEAEKNKMNRALEKAFPAFSRHAGPRTYYSYPEGSSKAHFVFRVVYEGAEPIADARVILFFAPAASPEPRFEAFDLETPRPLFAKDVWVEHISMKSELLSEYHKQDVYMMASVVLPKDYQGLKSTHQFPTVYYIEGFTGTESYATRAKYFLASEMGQEWQEGRWPTPMLRVTLGSRFKFGHTSFADTEANGPWGTALVSELIPYLESKYSAVSKPSGRFLHGHSSGAWSTLWLQLQFPDFFGGTWSSAPDPVDFSRFQVVNIYEAENAYWDPNGHPYPTSRSSGLVTCSNRDENLVERVYGRGNGGQWDAFVSARNHFALFSPRDGSGMPIPLFDKVSGAIDRDVAVYWERYDICKFLSQRPELLTTKLLGKVHVICGDEDTYYLDGACRSLQKLVGDGKAPTDDGAAVPNYVAMVPGDHTTIRSRAHYLQVYAEIAAVCAQNSQK
ncbi:hypothetical protein BBJ28_00015321 [Nothophytophthora sp. Chile5]|nr:hypothetical protein BBJ28_00015321 [Nothophytophthora sp. Chile5]